MARYPKNERDNALAGTRNELLQAALVEFATSGYAAANINRISLNAGFAKGTIYNYFPSKQALMLALLEQIVAKHLALITEAVRTEDDPARRLRRFFDAGFAFVERHPAEAKLLLATLYGGAAFKEHMGRLYLPMFHFVAAEIVAPGVEQGVFRQVDPASTATLLMTTYLGASSQVDEHGQPYLDPGPVAEFALHGLASKARLRGG